MVRRSLAAGMAFLSTAACWATGPLFLNVAGKKAAAEPVRVYAGAKADLTFALTAATTIEPQMRGDLLAVAQTLAAPVSTDVALSAQREGVARAGLQRFRFSVDLPAATRQQKFVLRLRVRTGDAEPWLPLPAVTLEAMPETWRATLRTFTDRFSSARPAAQEKLDRLFTQAEAKARAVAESAAGDDRVTVWFAEEETTLAPMNPPGGVRIIFKADVAGGVLVRRGGSAKTLTVFVDAGVLTTLETDPVAQETLERALGTAEAFLSALLTQD